MDTMQMRASQSPLRLVLSITLIFLLSIIPPSLALFSFFRYEDFYHLAFVKTHMPGLKWSSFLYNFQTKLYEYYRPITHVSYWVGYLIAGNNPVILHGLASLFFGLNAIAIYLIGRSFSGEAAGWISALSFATFGPVIVVSWWTGTFAILPGLFLFLIAILLFLNLSRNPKVLVPLCLFLFACTFFAKESFIMLSPILLSFCILSRSFRTRSHFIVAMGVIPLALLKIFIANVIMGATVNKHVHLNIFELDPLTIWDNIYDYWRLLIYGHNYWIILAALLGFGLWKPTGGVARYAILPAIFVLIMTFRLLHVMRVIEFIIILLAIGYVWYAPYYEKIWFLWIGLGLAPVLFWDIRIAGGIMNRLILEPSVGLALFLGAGLVRNVQNMGSIMREFIKDRLSFRDLLSDRVRIFKFLHIVTFLLFILIGFFEEATSLGLRQVSRELQTWKRQGDILETTITYLRTSIPQEATLILMKPSLSGMQVTEQIANALALFDRQDINIVYAERNKLPFSLKKQPGSIPSHGLYLISGLEINRDVLLKNRLAPTMVFSKRQDQFSAFVYKIDKLPRL